MKGKSDFVFLGLIGALIANTFIQSYLFGYVLTLNNYLALFASATVTILRCRPVAWKRYTVGFLLLLGVINIVSFGIGRTSLTLSFASVQLPSFEPISFLILIFYSLINRRSLKRMLKRQIYGTEEEREEKYQKSVNFYLDKFGAYGESDFEKLFNDFDEYPPEAQVALTRIRANRSGTIDSNSPA